MDVEPSPAASVTPPTPIWSTYFNDSSPSSFLLHSTSDGLLLSLPRFILQAASSVFEDLLTIPQPLSAIPSKPYDGQNAPGILPEVRIDHVKGSDLEFCLRLAHRDHVAQARAELLQRSWRKPVDESKDKDPLLDLFALINVAEKFDFKTTIHLLFEPFRSLSPTRFLDVLAVAIIYHDLPLASQAFQDWANAELYAISVRKQLEEEEDYDWSDSPELHPVRGTGAIKHSGEEDGPNQFGSMAELEAWERTEAKYEVIWRWRPVTVSDLSEELMERLPLDVLRLLLKIETKVVFNVRYPWVMGGHEFVKEWKKLKSFRPQSN